VPAGGWTLDSGKAYPSTAVAAISGISNFTLGNGTITGQLKFDTGIAQGIYIAGRVADSTHGYIAGYRQSVGGWTILRVEPGPTFTVIGAVAAFLPTNGQTYQLELVMSGSTLTLKVDGVAVVTGTDATFASGFVGMAGFTNASGPSSGGKFDRLQAS
jgi:hypothetical protein